MRERYTAYKDSGVEWIGEIPIGWEVLYPKKIFALRKERSRDGDVQLTASQKMGIVSQQEYIEQEGQRVVQVITGDNILKHVEAGDFVISMRSFQGGLEYSAVAGKISSAYVMLYPHNPESIASGYYKYLFKSQNYIEALQSTSNLVRDGQALRYANFVQVNLPFPPLREQRTIADYLDTATAEIDELVEEGEREIELLQEYRKAVISEAVTKGLDPSVPTIDSGIDWIGFIPKSWAIERLRYMGTTRSGMGNKSPDDFGQGAPFLTYKDVYDNDSFYTASGLVNSSAEDIRRFSVERGDIFFTGSSETVDELGMSSVCLETLKQGTFNGFTIRFRPSTNANIIPEYARFLFRSEITRGFLTQRDNSITRANLSQQLLKDLVIVLPPVEEQVLISEYLDEITRYIDSLIANKQEIVDDLREYRRSLISETVTGKFKVPGAE